MTKPNKPGDLAFVNLPAHPTDEELEKIGKEVGRTPEELQRVVDLCESVGAMFDDRDVHPSEALTALISMMALTIAQAPKESRPQLIQGVFTTLWNAAGLPHA